jgi:hypothetical protein
MIIGLGFRARSGKDTVATHLVNNYNYIQESFAYPLKEYIGRKILGFNDKQLFGGWKEIIDPEWGRTPRQMLQLIGTDALRNVVHKDFFVIPMKRKLKEHMMNGWQIVISDCRMLNEAKMIKDMGGLLIRIDRNNADKISNAQHSSEIELIDYDKWDYIIENNGTLEELYVNVDKVMRQINE